MSKNLAELDRLIRKISEGERLDQYEISQEMGYNPGYIAQQRSRAINNGTDIPDKFMNALKARFPKYATNDVAEEPAQTYKQKGVERTSEPDVLRIVAESNRYLAEGAKELAEGKKILAEAILKLTNSNADLSSTLRTTVGEFVGTPSNDPAIVQGILAAIVQVGLGKAWRTEAEGEATVRRLISAEVKKVRTPTGARK
jgi:hypothetical protein